MLKVYSIKNFYTGLEFELLLTEEDLDSRPDLIEARVSSSSNWNKEWGTPKGFYAVLLDEVEIIPKVSITYNKLLNRYDWEFLIAIRFPDGSDKNSFIACGYNISYLEAAMEAQDEMGSWIDQYDWR